VGFQRGRSATETAIVFGMVFAQYNPILQSMRLVDSSVFKALPRMAWAYWRNQSTKQSAIRLHFSCHLLDEKAAAAHISPAKLCERKALEKMVKPENSTLVIVTIAEITSSLDR